MNLKLYLFCPIFCLFSCAENKIPTIDLDVATDEVQLFGNDIISTGLYERDMAIAPGHQELIYSLGDYKQRQRALVMLRKTEEGWTQGQVLSFSGRYNDIEPFYSMEGDELYFASDRPLPGEDEKGDYNLWVVQRKDDRWSDPQPLGPEINKEGDEFFPAVTKTGNLYFTATRDGGLGREDIFVSRFMDGKYGSAEALDSNVNSPAYEFNAYVSPDEDLIVFSSFGRSDDLGGGDLYFSRKDELGRWKNAENLGKGVNSTALDYCPYLDVEKGIFYFTSERFPSETKKLRTVEEFVGYANDVYNGLGNIFRINAEVIF